MRKQYKTMIIGHVTMDVNTDYTGCVKHEPGGAVLYSSAAAYSLGHKVLAVTKCADTDKRAEAFILPACDVTVLPSRKNTDMENTYFTPDKEKRKSVCTSQGEAFTTADIPDSEAEIYHLAGLLYGDYSDELPAFLARKGKLAIDVQGYLRRRAENGEMYFADFEEKKSVLPLVTFLKTDAAEAEILTGLTDRAESARLLCAWGAKEVLITHNTEVLVCDGKEIYTCPIRAKNVSGRTGRGDTTFACYVTERLNSDIKEALLYATAAVSYKMERPGVLNCSRKEIDEYIGQFYSDYRGGK